MKTKKHPKDLFETEAAAIVAEFDNAGNDDIETSESLAELLRCGSGAA